MDLIWRQMRGGGRSTITAAQNLSSHRSNNPRMFWQYNFLVCSWRADVAVVSFNTPSRENTKYGDGFHPSVSPDAEAVIVDADGRPAGSEQKKKIAPRWQNKPRTKRSLCGFALG